MHDHTKVGFLERLGITVEQLEKLIEDNPSLRGMVSGYIAEPKLAEIWFPDYAVKKIKDHDPQKGDLSLIYKGFEVTIEVKSLKTDSIKRFPGGYCAGKYKCSSSDKHFVDFPDGSRVRTSCLYHGQFDLLAINLFEFNETWAFAFIKNEDLPYTKCKDYTPHQRQCLFKTQGPITWPIKKPYRDEPFGLLDEIIEKKAVKTAIKVENRLEEPCLFS